MPLLTPLHYSTAGLAEEAAYAGWRELIAPQYRVERSASAARAPRGGITYYQIGEIIANRTLFGAQRASRDRRLIDATPDHLVLQLWRSGGYRGEVDGRPIALGAGHVALANRRRALDVRFADSDTVGVVIPRHLLHGIGVDRFATHLDPARDRLAAARLAALHRRLPQASLDDVPALAAEILAFLRRLLDPSAAPDVLDAAELDLGVVELAHRVIAAELQSPDLSPERVAERLGVSRATLYRAFAPRGGLMREVWTMRLAAAGTALLDPLAAPKLSEVAYRHGFKSPAHFSRSFRERFGLAPREWQRLHLEERAAALGASSVPIRALWSGLAEGQSGRLASGDP